MAQLRNRETGLVRSSTEVERIIRQGSSCGPVIDFASFGEDVVFPAPAPSFDPITQMAREIAPVLTSKGHYEQAYEVVALDAETIAANQAAKAEEDGKRLEANLNTLWQAADAYEKQFISGVAIGLLTIGVIQQLPKSSAIAAWSGAIWTDYYTRKATVTADYLPSLDFSNHGSIPFSVPELRAELGM